MIKKYEYEQDGFHSSTPCPYVDKYIGSIGCVCCRYYINRDKEKRIVNCGFIKTKTKIRIVKFE